MTRSQIRKFVKRVTPKDWTVNISFFTDKDEWAYGARIWTNDEQKIADLWMNTDLGKELDPRSLVLHEIGHCCGENPNHSSMVYREVSAQEWAIKRAGDLRMTRIQRDLKDSIKNNWSMYKWNSGYRRYVLAHRMYMKKHGLVR